MTVSFNSGKFYVGQHSTNNLFDRYQGSGRWVRKIPIEKRRKNLHTYILEFFENKEDLKVAEQKLLDMYFGKPYCMNYNNKSTGFATGKNNPSNNLTEEQKNNRSKNHWSKTVEGRQWISENNPSRKSNVKLKRKESQIKNWNNPNYRENYIGCNHWIYDIKNKESAQKFLEKSKSNLELINKKASIKKLELDPIRKHLKFLNSEIKRIKADYKREESLRNAQYKKLVASLNKYIRQRLKKVKVLLTQDQKTARSKEGINNKYNKLREQGIQLFSDSHREKLKGAKKKYNCTNCGSLFAPHILSRYHNEKCKLRQEAII